MQNLKILRVCTLYVFTKKFKLKLDVLLAKLISFSCMTRKKGHSAVQLKPTLPD